MENIKCYKYPGREFYRRISCNKAVVLIPLLCIFFNACQFDIIEATENVLKCVRLVPVLE